ncbi:lysophospholipid acyltransferase family protein [bacterium]|nr:lysophospholipid acyltransferase family protein [bacterium]
MKRIQYVLMLLLVGLFRYLPYRIAICFARLLAWKLAVILRLRRSVAIDNLNRAFPEKNSREIESIYRRCWSHFLQVGVEMARIPILNEREIKKRMDSSQGSLIREILNRGKGVIVVSAHFGNWEWMGTAMVREGYDITFIVTSQSNQFVDEWMDRMRTKGGIKTANRKDAVKATLKVLKNNEVVAIMCDQDAGRAGIFTVFFGQPASTPRGPALFHLKTGAPIVFSSSMRGKDGKYYVVFEEMVFDELAGNRDTDELMIMQKITDRLEQEIRAFPDQWLWLHRRWKTKPETDQS